jgi:hypothetical protein
MLTFSFGSERNKGGTVAWGARILRDDPATRLAFEDRQCKNITPFVSISL